MFAVNWKEDSTAEVLARVTARNGSGSATGVNGEGNWLQQADISSIACNVYNLTSDPDGDSPNNIGPLTVSSVIVDTPVTSQAAWTIDTVGYNFIHTIAGTVFPTGGSIYRVEYLFTLSGGATFFEYFEGPANPLIQS